MVLWFCDIICVFIVPVEFSRIDLLLEGDLGGGLHRVAFPCLSRA